VRFRALVETIPASLATAVGISVASHLAVYGLTPMLSSLHLVVLGGTSTDWGDSRVKRHVTLGARQP